MNESMNYEGVCRTAPATPGLLNIFIVGFFVEFVYYQVKMTFKFVLLLPIKTKQNDTIQTNVTDFILVFRCKGFSNYIFCRALLKP